MCHRAKHHQACVFFFALVPTIGFLFLPVQYVGGAHFFPALLVCNASKIILVVAVDARNHVFILVSHFFFLSLFLRVGIVLYLRFVHLRH